MPPRSSSRLSRGKRRTSAGPAFVHSGGGTFLRFLPGIEFLSTFICRQRRKLQRTRERHRHSSSPRKKVASQDRFRPSPRCVHLLRFPRTSCFVLFFKFLSLFLADYFTQIFFFLLFLF